MRIVKIRILIHEPHLNQHGPGVLLHDMNPAPVVRQIQMRVADQRHVAAGAEIRILVDMLLNIVKRRLYTVPGVKVHEVKRRIELPVQK